MQGQQVQAEDREGGRAHRENQPETGGYFELVATFPFFFLTIFSFFNVLYIMAPQFLHPISKTPSSGMKATK